MLEHEVSCGMVRGQPCDCNYREAKLPRPGAFVRGWLARPDRKAIRIDPAETFSVNMELTPEFAEKLRKAAKPGCARCSGRGYHKKGPDQEWTLCSCLDVTDPNLL